MKIAVSEIREIPTELNFDEKDEWVRNAIAIGDETDDALKLSGAKAEQTFRPRPPGSKTDSRHTLISLSLRKSDEIYIISGKIDTELHLLCSRCAKPIHHPFHRNFTSLYTHDKAMSGDDHSGVHGVARNHVDNDSDSSIFPAHKNASFNETDNVEILYLESGEIDLGTLIAEQIAVDIPAKPLCKEDCKGICYQCGTDLNFGTCACSKINKSSPFATLLKDPKWKS